MDFLSYNSPIAIKLGRNRKSAKHSIGPATGPNFEARSFANDDVFVKTIINIKTLLI